MNIEVVSINCCVELTHEQWYRLNSFDFFGTVNPILKEAGASDVDYDGHFGYYIFFAADSKAVARKVVNALKRLLRPKRTHHAH